MERYRWLAGVIAAHPGRQVFGRTRLQKTINLLQSRGLPTNYNYASHYYGPYSEDLQADIALLGKMGLVREDLREAQDGSPYYVLTADEMAVCNRVDPFQKYIDVLSKRDSVVLELAATYWSFRELGCKHGDALESLRQKKGQKCKNGNEESAVELLKEIGLITQ